MWDLFFQKLGDGMIFFIYFFDDNFLKYGIRDFCLPPLFIFIVDCLVGYWDYQYRICKQQFTGIIQVGFICLEQSICLSSIQVGIFFGIDCVAISIFYRVG
eukprot:TRINITY_DN4639_c0_g1_i2.p9 TRINITY_DN4639_c0_g1~~TRINITY_DN4639_c0_g1_i2.p9  ORF type:complete len:101 (+),score=0.29 TRINITY_DN4639_c0_g1_i2:2204-2506(+)